MTNMNTVVVFLCWIALVIASDPEENVGSGEDLFEGDMRLTFEQMTFIDDNTGRGSIQTNKWTGAIVPYEIDASLASDYAMQRIRLAMDEWEQVTCIRFKNRTTEKNYIGIFKGSGCWSYVGMLGRGKQMVSLGSGCLGKATIVHELGHALGFYHEQSRPDRDQYVTIMWDNIKDAYKHAFQKHNSINSLGTPYDYGSVMHYGAKYFSKNGQPTIVPKQQGVQIGQRVGLSQTDVHQMNLRYNCPAPTVNPSNSDPSCDFENGWCSWLQETSDDFDWTRHSGSTSSSDTGPSSSHNGFYYAYIETTSGILNDRDAAVLKFKGVNKKGVVCFSFYYHMYGRDVNTLELYNNGKKLWSMKGDQGNAWKKAQVTIRENYDLEIKALRGNSFRGDIAIDDITVSDGSCGGVPPSPTAPATTPQPTTSTPVPPTTSSECKDSYGDWCKNLENDADYCKYNADWTKKNCAKTCGWCLSPSATAPPTPPQPTTSTPAPPTTPSECKDSYGDWCKNLENDAGYCKYHADWTKKNCAKTCGWCSAPSTAPPTNKPPTPPVTTAAPTNSGNCGSRPATRIVGGQEASINGWPWQAMLRYKNGGQFCGGTLVDPLWVVTAAHCVQRASPDGIIVRMGAHYRRSGTVGTEQDIDIVQIINHESYHTPMTYSNDIALLKLAKPAQLGKGVGIACLPDSNLHLPLDNINSQCWITGWGTLTSGGSAPNALMQASVPLVSKQRCVKGYPGKIHDSMLCAGLDQGGVDACQGDSGGPLVCEFNGRWYLEGATSWGYGCAKPMKYGVYAKVRYLRTWIDMKMNAGSETG